MKPFYDWCEQLLGGSLPAIGSLSLSELQTERGFCNFVARGYVHYLPSSYDPRLVQPAAARAQALDAAIKKAA